MKAVLALLLAGLLVGCASNPGPNAQTSGPWAWLLDPPCPGTRYYDPQVCKGESFGGPLPNQPYEAIVRYNRGERW